MSIDAQAGERQESVRGRVREKPEIEIDPSLPHEPSKFPLAFAITLAVFVTLGGAGAVAYFMMKPDGITDEQRANMRTVEAMQKAFQQVFDSMPNAYRSRSCRMLLEIVRKPCLPTVKPDKLAFDQAVLAVGQPDVPECSNAVGAYSKSRFDAKCD